jgi:hypothetical protein
MNIDDVKLDIANAITDNHHNLYVHTNYVENGMMVNKIYNNGNRSHVVLIKIYELLPTHFTVDICNPENPDIIHYSLILTDVDGQLKISYENDPF